MSHDGHRANGRGCAAPQRPLPAAAFRAGSTRHATLQPQTADGIWGGVCGGSERPSSSGPAIVLPIDPMALRPYDPTSNIWPSGHSRQHTEVFRLAEAGKCSLNGSDLALQAKYGGDRLKQSDWL
jgi:hypothetical protein